MRALRWLLLVPVAVVAWYAVFAAGLFTHFYVERNLCPPMDLISGFCGDGQVQMWLQAIVHAFVAISAVVVVVSAVVVAPTHKEPVMWATLATGLLVSAYLASVSHAWSLFAVAAASGVISVLIIARRTTR